MENSNGKNDSQNNPLVGFSETLKKIAKISPNPKKNQNICQDIFSIGKNINKEYFYPSEFPKLTNIKSFLSTTIKKGGKKRKNKRVRKSCKFRSHYTLSK